MSNEAVLVEKKNGVATVTLNRPDSMNALESDIQDKMREIVPDLAKDDGVRVVILTGSGRAFCAGGDLRRLKEGFDIVEGNEYMRSMYDWAIPLYKLEKPVVAAVNGFAVGAGFNLALACDIIIASNKSKFGQVFNNVGLVPDLGGTYYLPRLVGLHKAKELIFTNKVIDAEEAERLGIVNKIVAAEKLMEETYKLAAQLAVAAPVPLALAKRILNDSLNLNLEEVLELEAFAQGLCFQTDDHREGVEAFFEKRIPEFKGR